MTPFVLCGTTDGTEAVLGTENADLSKMAHVVRAKRVGFRRDLVGGVTHGGTNVVDGSGARVMELGTGVGSATISGKSEQGCGSDGRTDIIGMGQLLEAPGARGDWMWTGSRWVDMAGDTRLSKV